MASLVGTILTIPVGLVAFGLVLRVRTAAGTAPPLEAPDAARPLAWVLLVGAVVAQLLGIASFRFLHDDFTYLAGGDGGPFDGNGRLLPVDVIFRVGRAYGGPRWFFATANALSALLAMASLGHLVVLLTRSRTRAMLAVATFGIFSGWHELLRWGIGVSWLLAVAFALASLGSVVRASQTESERRAWGEYLLSMGFALASLVSYFAVALLIPPLAWVLVRRAFPMRAGPLRHPAAIVGYLVAFVLTFAALGLVPRNLHRLGAGAVLGNALGMVSGIADSPLISLALVALLVRAGLRRAAMPSGPRAITASVVDVVRSALRARVGASSLGVMAALGGIICAAPPLANARYFTDYYGVLPMIWLSIVAAEVLAIAAARWRPDARVLTLAFVLTLPLGSYAKHIENSSGNEARAWAQSVAAARPAALVVTRLVLVNACEEEATRAATAALLNAYWHASEQGRALAWTLGEPGLQVLREHEVDSDATAAHPPAGQCAEVHFCHAGPTRLRWVAGGAVCGRRHEGWLALGEARSSTPR